MIDAARLRRDRAAPGAERAGGRRVGVPARRRRDSPHRRGVAAPAAAHDLLVLPLHGDLPLEAATLRRAAQRKVVLATNVAETSLTIDGITAVIDSGLARVARYDPRHGVNTLRLAPISRAAADQRAGRAGRTGPGRCIRLWSAGEHAARLEREVPEIRRLSSAARCSSVPGVSATCAPSTGWMRRATPRWHAPNGCWG
jgi:ATP-dependent helicase HrpB